MSSNKPADVLPRSSGPDAACGEAARPLRRRQLLLAAVATGLPLAAWHGRPAASVLRWQGVALGAPASLQLHHDDPQRAQAALHDTLAELARLEALFSLTRADSWLSRLNAAGRDDAVPPEAATLLRAALDMAALSQGVFDPSVQPLWQLYFDHFVVQGQVQPPAADRLAQVLARVDWREVLLVDRRVLLKRPGMGLTLNGIAQGYITDRCAAVLRAHGYGQMLVDMGETRAGAAKPDGSAWRIGLADPRAPAQAVHTLAVVDQAVSTSGGYGTVLDAAGRYTHLIHPRSGRTAPPAQSVTVVAPSAMQADALSTTMALLPDHAARTALLQRQPGCRALCIDAQGQVTELQAAA